MSSTTSTKPSIIPIQNFMETDQTTNATDQARRRSKAIKLILIIVNCILLSVGQVGGPIFQRFYFVHGGKSRWFLAWLTTAGFPILLIPISISYIKSRRILITPYLFKSSAFLGVILGANSFFFAFGSAYLPVSVYALLGSTNLAFTAIFAFFVVKQKFTPFSINSVVVMTFGSLFLGYNMDGDRPHGESHSKYVLGFVMTLAAACLHGFLMTAVEYAHTKAGKVVTFDLVLQVQFLISMFGNIFCTVGMLITKDFQGIWREAESFDLGRGMYLMVVLMLIVMLQLLVIGTFGLVFCSSSLCGGVVASLLVPVQQVFAVVFLHEKFSGDKGMALAICVWGFVSYLYGEYKQMQNKVNATNPETDNASVERV